MENTELIKAAIDASFESQIENMHQALFSGLIEAGEDASQIDVVRSRFSKGLAYANKARALALSCIE
ncbi:hypothetical protein [Agaribacterium sp. ZY112]|uniref:hypothetical protein n=1 Tax=Agaribacterium sp. ZY112 TaxID=3233574 RepID=UPI00352365F6